MLGQSIGGGSSMHGLQEFDMLHPLLDELLLLLSLPGHNLPRNPLLGLRRPGI
jgi:hypothetical protein